MADFSLNIGKIFGVELQLHWTFLLLLFAAAILGGVVLFLFIVILFVMVVLHELAHSLTAIRSGIKVKRIILLPLGGASIIDLDSLKPNTAFRVAVAGPVASLLLAAVFGFLAVYAPGGPLREILQLLFLLNILLGVFNLLPAFPLDGGRVLKSYLERKRDQLSATKLAVTVSKCTLGAFVVGSIIYAGIIYGITSTNGLFVILWDFIIVLFVYGGAQQELESAYITKYTANLHVYDAISKSYVEVSPNTTMRQLYETLLSKKTHVVLFQNSGKIFAVSKLISNPFSKETEQLLEQKVSSYGAELPTIEYNAQLSKAISRMRLENTGIIAVKRNGRLAGVLISQHVESIIALHLPHNIANGDGK